MADDNDRMDMKGSCFDCAHFKCAMEEQPCVSCDIFNHLWESCAEEEEPVEPPVSSNVIDFSQHSPDVALTIDAAKKELDKLSDLDHLIIIGVQYGRHGSRSSEYVTVFGNNYPKVPLNMTVINWHLDQIKQAVLNDELLEPEDDQ